MTTKDKVTRIRTTFRNDPTVADMSDSRITEIFRLMAVPNDEFEYAIKQQVGGSIADLIRRTPTFKAEQVKADKATRCE